MDNTPIAFYVIVGIVNADMETQREFGVEALCVYTCLCVLAKMKAKL